MCRLSLIKLGNKQITKQLLKTLFTHLEKSNGGSGNGVGGWVNGVPYIVKGKDMTIDRCVDEVLKTKWDNSMCLFHTRIPSHGSVNDSNCHPFGYGEYITAHNGTVPQIFIERWIPQLVELVTSRGDDITDTEIVSFLVGKYGPVMYNSKILSKDMSGVFVSLQKDGTAHIRKQSYKDLEVWKLDDNSYIIASEFPDDMYSKFDIREVTEGCGKVTGILTVFNELTKVTTTKEAWGSNGKFNGGSDDEKVKRLITELMDDLKKYREEYINRRDT